ncbi:MAG TPA: hypothetical protein EYG78_06760 [Sulfurovum sp.]|nr:hypothetical protein [Sulfurovum sp.]
MEQMAYERAMEQFFPYVSAIGDQAEIFKSYPVRVRTQEKIAYYEVGASNIAEDGELIIDQNENLKESANAVAFEKLYLRPGDIILPYRSKKIHLGLYIESAHPLMPNPSLIIIRSGSVELGRYFFSCLNQPFIKSYIESSMIGKNGKNTMLDINKFKSLIIPTATGETIYSLHSIEKYNHYAKRVSAIHKQLDHTTTLLSAEAIAGEYHSLEKTFFEHMDKHIGKLEGIVSSMEASAIHSTAINMLRSDFVEHKAKNSPKL